MSTNFSPGPGQQPWTAPPTKSSSGAGAIVVIVIALGVVILLAAICLIPVAGFIFYARSSMDVEMSRMNAEMARDMAVAQAEQSRMVVENAVPDPVLSQPPAIAGAIHVDPGRTEWRYERSPEGPGGVIKQDEQGWVEVRSDRADVRFQEIAHSDEFVELFDPDRMLSIRLFNDRMEWRRPGENWFRGQEGKWKVEENTPPVEQDVPPADAPPQP